MIAWTMTTGVLGENLRAHIENMLMEDVSLPTGFAQQTVIDATVAAFEEAMRKAFDNYEPPEDAEAWSGGFADNH